MYAEVTNTDNIHLDSTMPSLIQETSEHLMQHYSMPLNSNWFSNYKLTQFQVTERDWLITFG